MYSIISFSIAACKSLRAPSCSSCSKNGFSASSARFSTEITLFSLTGVSFLFGTSGEAAEGLFFLLKGCAFSHLFIHNFRLYLLPGTRSLYRLTNRALAQIKELWQYAGEDELPPDSLLQAQVEALRILHIEVPLSAKRQFQIFCSEHFPGLADILDCLAADQVC